MRREAQGKEAKKGLLNQCCNTALGMRSETGQRRGRYESQERTDELPRLETEESVFIKTIMGAGSTGRAGGEYREGIGKSRVGVQRLGDSARSQHSALTQNQVQPLQNHFFIHSSSSSFLLLLQIYLFFSLPCFSSCARYKQVLLWG